MVKKNNRPSAVRQSVSRMRRAKKKNHLVAKCGSEEVLKNWDFTKTLKQNYEQLGLCADVNRIPTRLELLKEQQEAEMKEIERRAHVMAKRIAKGKSAIDLSSGKLAGVLSKVQEAEPAPPKKITSMPVREQLLLQKLIAKHKDDLHAMERDNKVNVHQWTEGHLRRRIQIYNELQAMANATDDS